MRLPLGMVNLLRMHIIPPLTISAGTHFTYPQRGGGLNQPPARLSQEWVLSLGPLRGRSTALSTELSWHYSECIYYFMMSLYYHVFTLCYYIIVTLLCLYLLLT